MDLVGAFPILIFEFAFRMATKFGPNIMAQALVWHMGTGPERDEK
jgi:hypothetical protein